MPGKFTSFQYKLGDIVSMKKKHPCGSKEWEVIRISSDVRVKCMGCERTMDIKRDSLEKATTKVTRDDKEAGNG